MFNFEFVEILNTYLIMDFAKVQKYQHMIYTMQTMRLSIANMIAWPPNCSPQQKISGKQQKTYKSNIKITPWGHKILALAKNLKQIAKCIFTSIIKLHLVDTKFLTTTKIRWND